MTIAYGEDLLLSGVRGAFCMSVVKSINVTHLTTKAYGIIRIRCRRK